MILEQFGKRFVMGFAGSNPKKWVTLFKSKGLFCIHKCVTIRHALSAQKLGVDLISLDGFEAAGHVGEGGARVVAREFEN